MNKKTSPPPAVWPDDYQSWSGSFDELVTTANTVLSEQLPDAKPITPRTARHYQHTQTIGRGKKDGRTSVFGFQDLSALVSAKSLVSDGWTLNHASQFLNSQPDPSSPSPSASAAYYSSAPDAPATSVVARLMAHSSLSNAPNTPRSFAAPLPLSHAFVTPSTPLRMPQALYGAASSPPAAETSIRRLDPAPWLHVYLDPAQWAQASPDERAAVMQALQQWINP